MKKKTSVALAGAITAVTVANAVAPSLNIKEEIELLTNSKLPIVIQTGTPVMTKSGNVYTGNFPDTVPCNRVATGNQNVTNGVNVTYAIPISIHSTNGKIFNIPTVKVTANPTIQYNGPVTPEKEKVAAEIIKNIKTQIGEQSGVNSSYSGKLNVTLNIGPVDWGMTINPNIEVTCGGTTQKVDVTPLKTTVQYVNHVTATASTPDSSGNFGIHLGFQSPQKNDWIYNQQNYKPKSITFNIKLKGTNGTLELNPKYANNPDIKYDPQTGNCTVSGTLAKNGEFINNLFKINQKQAGTMVNSQVVVNATNITYTQDPDNGVKGLVTTTYAGNSENYQHVTPVPPDGNTGIPATTIQNISQTTVSANELPAVTATSNVSADLTSSKLSGNKDWKLYGGMFVTNGQFVTKGSGYMGASITPDYIHLPENDINILKTGTPEQKYNLLKSLVSGTLPSGVIKVNARDYMFGGKPMAKSANFILYPLTKSGSTYTGTATMPAMPTEKSENMVLSKTVTFGYLPNGGGNPAAIRGVNPNTDYVAKDSSGKISGFIAGDNNAITISAIKAGKIFGFSTSGGQATSGRTGIISHNSSAAMMNRSLYSNTYIDRSAWGQDNSSWLDTSHKVSTVITAPSIGGAPYIKKGNTIKYTFNSKDFAITSPVVIWGITIPQKDIKIDGNVMSFTVPQDIPSNSSISFGVKFTNTLANNVSTTFSVVGSKDNPTGLVYSINGATVPFSDISSQTTYPSTANRSLTFTTSNGCLHYSSGVNKENESTLTGLLQNGSGQAKKYLAIIQIPKASSDSLAGNQGQPSQGGLSATLQNIQNADCPIYVLPKSAVNDKETPGGLETNEQAINDTNPFNMAGMEKQIESGKTGWIKYTPGMDLSNIASIAAMPTVKPHSTWKLNYGVKLSGVKSGSFQYTSSEFKYYDETDGVGSISNVVTLAPNGVNLDHMWSSTAVVQENGHTRSLTTAELNKTVTFTNSITGKTQTEPLSYLFSHGADIDADYNITPGTETDHLQQEVDLVNTKEALAKAGFELVKTTVKIGNGAAGEVNKDYFTTTGIMANTQFTRVVFTLALIKPEVHDEVIVQVKGADGKYTNVVKGGAGYEAANGDNPGTEAQQGENGTPLTGDSGVKTPNIPLGYKIDGVIVSVTNSNGSVTNTTEGPDFKVPSKLTNHNVKYTYQISAAPVHDTVIVKVKQADGTYKEVAVGEPGYVAPQTGTPGMPLIGDSDVKNPVIPTGYRVDSIELNGKVVASTPEEIKAYLVEKKLGKIDNNYVFNISKIQVGTVSTQVVVEDASGKVLPKDPATQAQKIVQGADGKTLTGTAIDEASADTIKIGSTTINLSSNDAVSQLGKLGYQLIKTTVQVPTDKTPVNTTVADINKDKVVNGNTAIVYTLKKLTVLGGVTVQVNNLTTGKVEVAEYEVQRAAVGTTFSDKTAYIAPNGYSIVKTTLNGTDTTATKIAKSKITEDTANPYRSDSNPTTAEMAGDQHIVYSIVKNVKDTVTVLVDGKPMTETIAKLGKDLNVQNGPEGTPNIDGATPGKSGVVTPTIPKGYMITSITVNGKQIPIKGYKVPKTLDATDTNIVYNITKIEPVTVKVVTVDDKGNSTGVKQVTTTTTNNVSVGGTSYTKVQEGSSTSKINTTDTGINVPEGYHITGLKVNGVKINPTVSKNGVKSWNVPTNTEIGKDGTQVVYTITKNAPKTFTTVVTVTTSDGGSIPGYPKKTITTTAGGDVTGTGITVPKGYKIVKVTTDGGVVTTHKTPNGGIDVPPITKIDKNHTVHYILEKVGSLSVQVIVDGDPQDSHNVAAHLVKEDTNVAVGTDISGYKIIVPKGYKLVKTTVQAPTAKDAKVLTDVTVNSEGMIASPDLANTDIVQGTTKIVYHLVREKGDITTTVVGPNGKTFKHNPPITGNGNDGDVVSPKTTTITPPPHYHVITVTVNGKVVTPKHNPDGSYSVPPMNYNNGHQKVVYTVAPDTGSVDVTVKDEAGNIVIAKTVTVNNQDVINPATDALTKLSGYELTDKMKETLKKDGYELVPVKTTVQVNNGTINSTTQTELANDNLVEGTTHIVYVVKKAPVLGTVTETVVGTDGHVYVTKHDVTKVGGDVVGTPVKPNGATTITPPSGTTVVKVTVGGKILTPTYNKTTGTWSVPQINVPKGNTDIVWTVAPVKGKVTVEVLLNDAKTGKTSVYKATKEVQDSNVGTEFNGDGNYDKQEIPAGYHLVKTTVNGVEKTNGNNPATTISGKVQEATTAIVYTIEKNAPKTYQTTVTVTTTDGSSVPGVKIPPVITTPEGGTVTGTSTGVVIPKGYKIVKVTEGTSTTNGTPVTPVSSTDKTTGVTKSHTPDITNVTSNHYIHYVVEKTGTVSVAVLVKDPKTGKTTTFTDSTINGVNHIVDTDVIGAKATNTGITVPKGYHLVSTTIDNKPATATAVSGIKIIDGNINVVYTIEKNTPPAPKKGVVTVTVVGTDGHVYVTKHDVTGNGGSDVGTDVNPNGSTTITPPSGTTVTTVTVNGKTVKPTYNKTAGTWSIPPMKVKEGKQDIVWTVAPVKGKVTVEVLLKDAKTGKTSVYKATKEVQDSNVGTEFNGDGNYDKQEIPAGYHLVKTTVNGVEKTNGNNPATTITGKVQEATTAIVYTIEKDAPKTGSVDVTVNIVDANNNSKILSTPIKNKVVIKEATVGTAITGANYSDIQGIPEGYHLVSASQIGAGTDVKLGTGKELGTVTGKVGNGVEHIVYNIVKNTPPAPKKGVVTVTVVGTDGHVYVTKHDVTENGGSDVGTDVNPNGSTTITPPAGTTVTTVTVNGKVVTAIYNKTTGTWSIPPMKVKEGKQDIVWTVKPVVKYGNVTVKIVTDTGKVLVDTHTVDTDVVGAEMKNQGFVPQKGYHLVKTTVDGTVVSGQVTGKVKEGTTSIVYTVAKDKDVTPKPEIKKGSLTIEVVGVDGQVFTPVTTVMKDANVGTTFTGYEGTIPKGYHLVKVTLNNNEVSKDSLATDKIAEGTQSIVYVVEKDPTPVVKKGTVTVEVKTQDGTIITASHIVDTDVVGAKIKGADFIPVKGYHLVKTTVDGTEISGKVTGNIVEGNTAVVYTVAKDKVTPPKPTPEVKTGTVTVEIKTESGTILTKQHNVMTDVAVGTSFGNSTNVTIPDGYHLVKVTKDGNTTTAKDLTNDTVTNGTTHVVYIVTKNTTPKPVVKKGTLTVEVKDTAGNIIVKEHTVQDANVGTKLTGYEYTPAKGYHIVQVSLGGQVLSNGASSKELTNGEITNGVQHVVYVIEKDATPKPDVKPTPKYGSVTVEVITQDGTVITKTHTVDTDIVGNKIKNAGYTDIPGYTLVKTQVDGNDVSKVDGNIVDGVTKVVYIVKKNVTPEPKPTPDVNPEPKPDVKPTPKYGSVTVEVITEDGTIITTTHTVDRDIVGSKIKNAGYTDIPGYTLVKTQVDGNDVLKVDGNIVDGVTKVVYIVKKNVTPKPTPDVTPVPNDGGDTSTIHITPETGHDKTSNTPVVSSDSNTTNTVSVPDTSSSETKVHVDPKAKTQIATLPDTGLDILGNKDQTENTEAGLVGLVSALGLAGLFLRRRKK